MVGRMMVIEGRIRCLKVFSEIQCGFVSMVSVGDKQALFPHVRIYLLMDDWIDNAPQLMPMALIIVEIDVG